MLIFKRNPSFPRKKCWVCFQDICSGPLVSLWRCCRTGNHSSYHLKLRCIPFSFVYNTFHCQMCQPWFCSHGIHWLWGSNKKHFALLCALTQSTRATITQSLSRICSAIHADVSQRECTLENATTNKLIKKSHFSRDVRKEINEYIASYVDTCNDFDIDNEPRLKLFRNGFVGNSNKFNNHLSKQCRQTKWRIWNPTTTIPLFNSTRSYLTILTFFKFERSYDWEQHVCKW